MTNSSGYGLRELQKDVQAALTVSVISLPQSMAYALIAGVDPRFGLYTAIVFAAVASALGSSSHLVNGPTGAVSLVVFSALSFIDADARVDAYEAMFLLAIMVGVVQIAIGVLKLGGLTRYISESVITGFMVGAAVLTIIGQVGNALGLKNQGTGHQHVFYRLWLTLTQSAPLNFKAIAISAASIALSMAARRAVRRYRLPQLDTFIVLLLVTVLAYFLGWSRPDATGQTAVGLNEAVPQNLPGFHIAVIQWKWLASLSSSAVAIAFLGLLEALAIAKAIASETRQRLDVNQQCLAEGLGNLAGGFFRCMPGSGSLTRSAINYQSGATSKVSGVLAAGFVALLVLAFAPLTHYIPRAGLAGLLIVAASRLIDLDRLRYVARAGVYDAVLLGATAFSALAIGVEFAILIGVAVSLLLYAPRAAKLRVSELVVSNERIVRNRVSSDPKCTALTIYDLEGDLFFGAAPALEKCLDEAATRAREGSTGHLVLRVKRLRNPDAVCLEKLEHFLKESHRQGLVVFLAGVRADLEAAIGRLRFAQWFSHDRVFVETDDADSATLKAVRAAYQHLGKDNRCEHCNGGRVADPGASQAAYYLV
jgi:sulfate permease, SulP family